MRTVMVLAFLALAACDKQPAQDVTCASYVGPYQAYYPDEQFRKSDIALCSDDTYRVTSLEQDGASFEASGVTIELMDPDDGSHYYTTFRGQKASD